LVKDVFNAVVTESRKPEDWNKSGMFKEKLDALECHCLAATRGIPGEKLRAVDGFCGSSESL